MRKIECLILGMFFGFLPVLLCFVPAWFTSAVLLDDEKAVALIALSGAAVGVVVDFLFLKRWVKKAYEINNRVLAAIYIFYSIGALGFGMGVPIFNLALG
ncbi:MAG: hypothetical protein ACYS9T_10835, partial [Planctomycetota bacterium]